MRVLVFLAAMTGVAGAEPVRVGAGLEAGALANIHWLGAAAEIEVGVTDHIAIRATGRLQDFEHPDDECFGSHGRQSDVTIGVRVEIPPPAWARTALPFVAAEGGVAYERVLDYCPPVVPLTRSTWMARVAGGVDIPLASHLLFRAELRVSHADFVHTGGWDDKVYNDELSVAAMLVARL